MSDDLTDEAAELHARGDAALVSGDVEAAADLAARALALFEAADPEHPDVANALLLCARVAHSRSDFRRACELAERAVGIMEAASREWPDELIVWQIRAHAIARLAAALQALGRYDDAERRINEALVELEPRLGTAGEIGDLQNLLGISHKYQARYDEAAARYRRAIEIVEALHGRDCVEMAGLEHNLGGLHQAKGEPALAEPHARRAVELRERLLGPDHPDVAADLSAWATILDDLGRSKQAEQALQRALAIFERAYGAQHFEVGFTLGTLGAIYAGAERFDEAAAVLTRARTILATLLDDDHVEVARIDEYLAIVAHHRGDRATALALAERALAACTRTFGADHPRTRDARATRDAVAI